MLVVVLVVVVVCTVCVRVWRLCRCACVGGSRAVCGRRV